MAGKIIADTIEASGSQISLNVGNVTILTASSTGLTLIPTTNVNVNLTNSIVTLTNGSATSPGLTFSGNTRTGLFMPSANTLAFTAANTESMRIDSSGNVGIGTNSPAAKLHIDAGSGLEVQRYNTTSTLPYVGWYVSGTRKAYQQWDANYGWILDSESASTGIVFRTQGSERMRITSAGLLGVNATSFPYSEQVKITFPNTQAIHCNESTSSSSVNYLYFTKGATPTNVGAIYYNGSVMAYQTTSDYRLKENIAPMTGALTKIAALKPVTYTWKDNQRSGEGFIAHELQEHFPDAVSGTKDAVDEKGNPKYQGMDASILIATLTAAIQELKAIVDAQAVEIAALKAK